MLGLSLGFAAVVATVGNLGRVIASLPVGWLADQLWGRRVLTAAGLILALLLITVSLSRSVWVDGACSSPAGYARHRPLLRAAAQSSTSTVPVH